jgi:hypothetical protein
MPPVAWIALVLGVVAVLLLADRLVARLPARPRQRRPRAGGTSGGGLSGGDLIEVFAPSARHVAQERERRRADVQLVTSGGPGAGPLDLDAGVVTIAAEPPAVDPPVDPR